MISEVLDASKLGTTAAEEPQALAVDCYLSELCKQYRLIAQANGISFQEAFPETFTITLPPKHLQEHFQIFSPMLLLIPCLVTLFLSALMAVN